MLTDVRFFEVTAPIVAGWCARPGDLVAVCTTCTLLPVVVLRKIGGRWDVIAKPAAINVAALGASLAPRSMPRLRAA